jgi:hypothetical protein
MNLLEKLKNGLQGNNLRDVFYLYIVNVFILSILAIIISLFWNNEFLFEITPFLVIFLVAFQYVSLLILQSNSIFSEIFYYQSNLETGKKDISQLKPKKKLFGNVCSECFGSGKITISTLNGVKYQMCPSCSGSRIYPERFQAEPELAFANRGCFIATATYGSELAPEVKFFRHFRDTILVSSKLGRLFIKIYYLTSPPLAFIIRRLPILKVLVRELLLEPVIKILKSKINLDK